MPKALLPAETVEHRFADLARRPFSFILESSEETRCSFSGSEPCETLVIDADGTCRKTDAQGSRVVAGNPIENVTSFIESSEAGATKLPTWLPEGTVLPRTVGYLAYELGPWLEPKVPRAGSDPLAMPLAVLATYPEVTAIAADHSQRASITFQSAPPLSDIGACPHLSEGGRVTSQGEYRKSFELIKEAIAAGDIYQANLARYQCYASKAPAVELFQRLGRVQPVPHGAFLNYGGFQVISNSPETFLEIQGDDISVFPIKGTRPANAANADDDQQARDELCSDPKEAAEHVMIVDLERNDLGRIAKPGSVNVDEFATLRSFQTVHHLESKVTAKLRSDVGFAQIAKACFPCGSITGAPKIRAMEIIAECEGQARGVYTGTIGCWNGGRQANLSVAIRTAVASNECMHYWSGGGIVADSDPDKEWEEASVKARAFLRAMDAS